MFIKTYTGWNVRGQPDTKKRSFYLPFSKKWFFEIQKDILFLSFKNCGGEVFYEKKSRVLQRLHCWRRHW